ncbi:DUF4468 domain-containing protein [Flavobacterium sp. XS2P24]|uniref:DUF4468 domain-containing protein n=1 Tax=Flavobacterium sp. XS2P24 TaxID=3041249 RepID=UPI0024A7C3C2|nr:DUF4468 domain-containing protein [Flavobacterium sp. XS2P24]MDI6050163.1 DUF4468 domain-containing protein [Flavobacterium sp. XS2P24]
MRKFILLMLFITTISNAQEYKLEEKTIAGTFEVKEKTKSEIFSSINKWISINYNSSKNVIQMNDLESGTIIIKGINEVKFKNPGKVLNPKIATEFSTMKFNHLIEINIKDNKYRIIYKLIQIATDDYGYNDMTMNCINLNGNRADQVQIYIDAMEKNLKKGLIGKEKKESFIAETRLSFDEINTNLINDMKSTMLSVEKSVSNTSKEGW